ncbi:hypothetical protein WSM22_05200 [Cytophagales bacterium WSM2-2]|nr:hypothetical protein WSM22_05200 [Cytophagales bacterium WSM2-2]
MLLLDNPGHAQRRKRFPENQLYQFLATTDKKFCDQNLVVHGDCNFGNLYFTKKGNVIYRFYCIGSDTVTHLIGKYSSNESGIKCSFNKKYSFAENALSNKTSDANSGKVKKVKSFDLTLTKIDCQKFDFHFQSNGDTYVLQRPPESNSNYFFTTFKKIKVFSSL